MIQKSFCIKSQKSDQPIRNQVWFSLFWVDQQEGLNWVTEGADLFLHLKRITKYVESRAGQDALCLCKWMEPRYQVTGEAEEPVVYLKYFQLRKQLQKY